MQDVLFDFIKERLGPWPFRHIELWKGWRFYISYYKNVFRWNKDSLNLYAKWSLNFIMRFSFLLEEYMYELNDIYLLSFNTKFFRNLNRVYLISLRSKSTDLRMSNLKKWWNFFNKNVDNAHLENLIEKMKCVYWSNSCYFDAGLFWKEFHYIKEFSTEELLEKDFDLGEEAQRTIHILRNKIMLPEKVKIKVKNMDESDALFNARFRAFYRASGELRMLDFWYINKKKRRWIKNNWIRLWKASEFAHYTFAKKFWKYARQNLRTHKGVLGYTSKRFNLFLKLSSKGSVSKFLNERSNLNVESLYDFEGSSGIINDEMYDIIPREVFTETKFYRPYVKLPAMYLSTVKEEDLNNLGDIPLRYLGRAYKSLKAFWNKNLSYNLHYKIHHTSNIQFKKISEEMKKREDLDQSRKKRRR